MALKLSVKIGDVTNLSDARYAAGMGVDYIGFNIDSSSKHFVTPEVFKEIINWISGIGIIGEIGNQLPDDYESYGSFLPETTNLEIAQNLDELIFKLDARHLDFDKIGEELDSIAWAKFYVIEVSETQIKENRNELTELCATYPIYLSAEFSELLLEKVVNYIQPLGIEIKGSLEDQPGFKDYEGIADVLEWLEVD